MRKQALMMCLAGPLRLALISSNMPCQLGQRSACSTHRDCMQVRLLQEQCLCTEPALLHEGRIGSTSNDIHLQGFAVRIQFTVCRIYCDIGDTSQAKTASLCALTLLAWDSHLAKGLVIYR